MALFLCACDSDRNLQDLHEDVAKLKAVAGGGKKKKEEAPAIKPPPVVVYQAEGLRIPFQFSTGLEGKDKKGFKIDHPLQSYPLNMLRFVGVLSQDNQVYAFILAPDNIVYQVKLGDKIGDRNGKIVNMYPDHLTILEQDVEDGKPVTQRIATLQLKD